MKMKIEINDNFNSIYNYILSASDEIKYTELLQFCIDYQCYQEFYINLNVWKILVEEKNKELDDKKIADNNKAFSDSFSL